MKEFKFLAIMFPLSKLFLICVPLWILFALAFFFGYVEQYFFHLFIGNIIFIASFALLFVKMVRIQVLSDGVLKIFINGNESYVGNAQKLEYIIGGDSDGRGTRAEFGLSFNDKKFYFTLFQRHESGNVTNNKQLEILRCLTQTYNLERSLYKKDIFGKAYIYKNPSYTGYATDGYKKSEK